jgi:hypothetical protein
MPELRCRDLQPGDILLKLSDGGVLSRVIQFGQNLTGHVNPQIVHAGVLFDNNVIIESQGAGVLAHDLRVQNARYAYIVFRSSHFNMARGAGTCAKMMFDIHQRTGGLSYALSDAAKSIFGGLGRSQTPEQMELLLDRILAGRGQPFFCSHFVVYLWQFVAEQNGMPGSSMFPASAIRMNPSNLATQLVTNPSFREIGWLSAGVR